MKLITEYTESSLECLVEKRMERKITPFKVSSHKQIEEPKWSYISKDTMQQRW